MYLDEAEKNWQPGKPGPITAGRFDYGPELTVAPHPKAWAGEWTAEITKANSVKLTSPREDAGIQLVREFRLVAHGKSVGLSCKQTMTQRLEGDARGVPLGPVVLAGRRHLRRSRSATGRAGSRASTRCTRTAPSST